MNQKQIRAAVEAMLFASGDPIGADKLAQAVQLPQLSVITANIQPVHMAIMEGEQEIFFTFLVRSFDAECFFCQLNTLRIRASEYASPHISVPYG